MITHEFAERLAKEWIESWNSHNLESILSHYSADIELTSPIAVKLLGVESGMVQGIVALRSYFEKGLAALPDLEFEQIGIFTGVGSITLLYRRKNGPTGAEVMMINNEGKIEKVIAHYSEI